MRALVLVLGAAARVALADAFSHSPYAPERAFCAAGWSVSGDTLTVERMEPAVTKQATPLTVTFACPAGTLPSHTHTSAVCSPNLWYCDWPAALRPCAPSNQDRAALVADGRPFGIVACRDGTVVAWRAGDE